MFFKRCSVVLFGVIASISVVGLRADEPTRSAITYQGHLKFDGVGLDESCDVVFTLFDAPAGGNFIAQYGTAGAPVQVNAQKGVFTAMLDFGEEAFDGGPRWVEVAVRKTADGGAYSILTPRQCLTATPYALHAMTGGDPTSLDEAYNKGGPGEGRSIHANAGPLSLNGPGGLFVEGNVGIGVTDPTYKLELDGWLRLHQGGIVFPDGTTQTTAAQGAVGDEPRGGDSFWNDGDSILYADPIGTFVGIGTSSPEFPLHIVGDVKCDGSVRASAFASNSPFIAEAPAGTTRLWIGDDLMGRPPFAALGSTVPQRVPESLLHLADDMEDPIITLETNPDGSAAVGFAGIDFTDRTGMVSNLLGDLQTISNLVGVPDALFINRQSQADLLVTPFGGFVGIGLGNNIPFRKLHVSDGGFFVSRFSGTNTDSSIVEFRSVSSDTTWEFAVSGSVGAFAGAVEPGSMYLYRQGMGGIIPFIADRDGFVGMNFPITPVITPPQAALEVRGTPGVDGIMFPDGSLQTSAATDDHGSLMGLLDDDHPQYAHLPGRAGGQILNGGDALGETLELHGSTMGGDVLINPIDGHVGIGTISPEVRLHVVGGTDVNAAGGGFLQLGASNALNLALDDNEIQARSNGVAADLAINREGGNVRIGAISSSNLGIGPIDPFWSIDVADNQAVSRFITLSHINGSVLELRNDTANPNYLGAINFNTVLNDFLGQIGYLGTNDMTFRVNGLERVRFDSMGNVGIGTTMPEQQLHVVNNARVDGTVYTEMVSSNAGLSLQLKTGDAPHIHIEESTGYVGVGPNPPMPPEEALHVDGCVKADCYKVNGEKPIDVSALSAVASNTALTMIPTPNGTMRVRPNQTGTQNVLIPVHVASSILGTPQELVRVRVCYRVTSSLSFINNTRARTTQDNGTFANLLDDPTDRKSIAWNCYEVILPMSVAIDGPLFLQLELSIGGTGSSHDIEIGRMTVTVVDA